MDEQSNVLLTVPYTDVYPWPVAAGGTGHSIVLANPTYGEGDPRAWAISDSIGGSPGQMDAFHPSPLRNVVINEILPHSENPAVPQFIELYNHSTNSVDVSGCILTDDPTTNKFVIPGGHGDRPGGFCGLHAIAIWLHAQRRRARRSISSSRMAAGFWTRCNSGRRPTAFLMDAGRTGRMIFTPSPPTRRAPTTAPIFIGDIVINELMYDPISGNDDDQYIELYNKGTNTIDLAGWQFTSGVTFTFPPNVDHRPQWLRGGGARTSTNLFANYTNLNSRQHLRQLQWQTVA